MQCDMCGRTAQLVKARIEEVALEVCEECARFGTVMARPRQPPQLIPGSGRVQRTPAREKKETLIPAFAESIRKKREQLCLTQEAFARLLAERESLVQKMEAGTFVPSIDMARKMEYILKMVLVEEDSEEAATIPRGTSTLFTLGDFVRKKRSGL